MPRHCPTEAFEYLEAIEPGLYRKYIQTAIDFGGVVYNAPDCFCCAVPHPENPQHILILFQCSELPALWRLAAMHAHKFTHVRFRRDFKNNYPERIVPMAAILRKTSLVDTLNGNTPAPDHA